MNTAFRRCADRAAPFLSSIVTMALIHNSANYAARRCSPVCARHRKVVRSSRLPRAEFNVKRLYSAFLNTVRGFGWCLVHEAAVREEAVLLVIAVPLGFFLAPGVGWYVAMIGSLLAVLAVELLN